MMQGLQGKGKLILLGKQSAWGGYPAYRLMCTLIALQLGLGRRRRGCSRMPQAALAKLGQQWLYRVPTYPSNCESAWFTSTVVQQHAAGTSCSEGPSGG